MEIRYKTKKLQKICTDANAARKAYGTHMAVKIHQRIDEISAADSIDLLVTHHIGRCHLLSGDRKNQYAMDLIHPYRLIFTRTGDDIQIAKVQEITDYH